MDIEQLKAIVAKGQIPTELMMPGLELKRSWTQNTGHDISALANNLSLRDRFVLIGVEDSGRVANHDETWLKQEEQRIANHIHLYLSPQSTLARMETVSTSHGCCVILEVCQPGDVVYWNNEAYLLIGTHSHKMTPAQILDLQSQLPGDDYSRRHSGEPAAPDLVFRFAEFLKGGPLDAEAREWTSGRATPDSVLSGIRIKDSVAAWILFGSCSARVIHFDADGNINDQYEIRGLIRLLDPDFVESLQSWTRKNAATLSQNSLQLTEERPYPTEALREVLANAVAHSSYHRESGRIRIEMHPNRLVVRNVAPAENEAFLGKWFSRASHVRNRSLMNALRMARLVDEAGNGKLKIFRHMMEAGKPLPQAEAQRIDIHTVNWSITLYSQQPNQEILNLIARIKTELPDPDEWKVATALVLLADHQWSTVLSMMEIHYQGVAKRVINSKRSPVVLIREQILVKRWAVVARSGQMSRSFTPIEKANWYQFFCTYTHLTGADGLISFSEIREILGMSDTNSETTQLSNLLREWRDKDRVSQAKKRVWWAFPKPQETSSD